MQSAVKPIEKPIKKPSFYMNRDKYVRYIITSIKN